MELFISFSEITHFFRKTRIKFALVVLAFGLVFGLMPLKFVHPTYSATTTYTVTCGVPENSDSDYRLQYTNILYSRVQSSVALASGNEIAAQTAERAGVPKSDILKITAEQLNSAPVVKLTVNTTDASKAALLADTAAQVLTEDLIKEFPNPQLVATITDKAAPAKAQSTKSAMVKAGLIGLVVGFIVYLCIGIFIVLSDKTIRNSRYAEEAFKTTLLAEVPESQKEAEDACRKLRAAALHQSGGAKIFLIADVCENNGADVVAAGLAASLAQAGKKVILAEENFRTPSLTQRLEVKPQKTAADVLSGACTAAEALVSVPSQSGLAFLAGSSNLGGDPADLLAGEASAALVKELAGLADYVVLCAPSDERYPDAENIAALSEAVILSVRYGSTPFERLGESFRRVAAAGGKTIGFVTTGA